MAKDNFFVITGCGRSGTQYLAECLLASGIDCTHEQVFRRTGVTKNSALPQGDSSWYAASRIQSLPSNTPVIHIVRNPVKVVTSLYRLGFLSRYGWRNIVIDPNPIFVSKNLLMKPKVLVRRIQQAYQHYKLLRQYTTCLEACDELARLWQYWYQWNRLIECQAKQSNVRYLRVRLEDIDTSWDLILSHIGYEKNNIQNIGPKNKKLAYPARNCIASKPPPEVVDMARRYGYNLDAELE